MTHDIVPLTADLWPAFEELFGKQGACYGCWCTHFRLSPAMRRESNRDRNKDLIKARIEAGPPPGLLALRDGVADGWMQIGPRFDVPEWNNAGRASAPTEPADAADPAVWAVSCFFLRTKARGQGLTHRMVAAGIEHARKCGARRRRGLPDRPVARFALARAVRRLDAGVRESRLHARRDPQGGPAADAAGALASAHSPIWPVECS